MMVGWIIGELLEFLLIEVLFRAAPTPRAQRLKRIAIACLLCSIALSIYAIFAAAPGTAPFFSIAAVVLMIVYLGIGIWSSRKRRRRGQRR
jgi:uncharacterized membrane protein YccC